MKRYVLVMVMLLACFVGFNCGAESKCDAGANVKFQATDVYLNNGQSVIDGYFYNEGSTGATVTTVELSFTASDNAGNYIFSDSSSFSNVNAWVPAYSNVPWRFTIRNSNAHGYTGEIKWHVDNHVSFRF